MPLLGRQRDSTRESTGEVEVLKLFNQKNIYLLRKMQKILIVKILNLRKQICCPECESTLFVKMNLRQILKRGNFILLFIIFI